MASVSKFEELIVWQKARQLAKDVYGVTRVGGFAKDYGFCDQIRRAVVSIGSNVAEGFDRGNNKEFLTFLGVAKGSAAEVRSQLHTAFDVGYLADGIYVDLISQAEEVSRLLNGLMVSIRETSYQGMRYHREV